MHRVFLKFNRRNIFILVTAAAVAGVVFFIFHKPRQTAAEQAQRINAACGTDEKCYWDEFRTLSQHMPFKDVHEDLLALENISTFARECHTIAHTIASEEVAKDPAHWKELLQQIDPQECSGGFFHGLLEGRERFDPTFTISAGQLNDLCPNETRYSPGSCAHIFGHLLLVESDGKLNPALNGCDSARPDLIGYCYGGVFMEQASKVDLSEHGLAQIVHWDKGFQTEFEDLCRHYNGDRAQACWGELGFIYSQLNNDNPPVVLGLCSRAGRKAWTDNCYLQAIGKIVLTNINQEQVNNVCQPYAGSTDTFNHCVSAAVSWMMGSSAENYQKAADFCSSLAGTFKERCFQIVKSENRSS